MSTDELPPGPLLSFRTKLIVFTLLFLMAYVLFDGPFVYSAVCTKCGMRRHSRDWFVPFTPIKLGTAHSEVDTPLSTVLHQKRIVPDHKHAWLFIHGSGHGITCAHGSGSSLFNSTNQRIADTIALLHDRGKTDFRDRLISGLLDHRLSGLYGGAAYDTPASAMTDVELQAWIDAHTENLEDLLRAQ